MAICLLSPAGLRAQEAQNGNFEQVGLNFDLRHLGNAARSDASTAAARGLVQSDDRLTVGVDVVVSRSLGRNTLKLAGNVGYDFYRRNERLNRERIGLKGDVGVNVGPCLAEVSGQLDRRQSDLDSIALVNLPGPDSVRNTETVQVYRVEGRCGYVYGLRPSLGYEHSRGDNSNPLRDISDYKSNRVFGGIAYDHPVIGKAKLTYEHENVDFDNRVATPLAPFSGYQVDELRLQLSRDIGTLLTAEAMLAYNWLKPDNSAAPDFKGTTWRLAGTIKPGQRLQIRAVTERSLRPSLGSEALYSKQSFNEVRGSLALSERISVSGGFSVTKRDYSGAQANFGPLLEEDKFRRIFAGMTLRASRRLELGLEGGHEKRDGTGTIFDYSGGYVGLRGRLTL
ncbi:MAG: hypothetical protein RL339_2892 [Pseudomonadota bacterium]